MRWLLAQMKHETNTFSPVPTDLARFRAWSLHEGEAAVRRAFAGTNHPIAAFIELADEEGARIAAPVAAEAMPSGLVHREAYDYITSRILDALRAGDVDAAFLDLHGAMVAEGEPDGEGALLARMREIAPNLPIAVCFDMHANLTERIVANATAINCYKVYPHTDMREAGMAVGRVMVRALKGQARPVMALRQPPILAQTLMMGTGDEPMGPLQAMTREMEREPGILLASLFGGFPMADIPMAGLSTLVVADGDPALAEQAAARLADAAWERREGFAYRHEPLAEAVARAKGATAFPCVLLDHADNVGSGGMADTMTAIAEVLRQGLENVAMAAVWDLAAVRAMQAAGVGAELTLDLGGGTEMPSIGEPGRPLRLTGRVRRLSDGEWTVRGPMYTGSRVTSGPTALFETGGMSIVVTSLHHEPWDAGILTSLGVDPAHCRYILLKSRVHYRAGFGPYERTRITLDGTGVTTSDNSILRYEAVRRPIFPLDRPSQWQA